MMKPKSVVFLMTFGLLLAIPVLAHDTWLLARPSTVQPGDPVVMELTSGMAFPAPEIAIKPERIARAGVRLAGAISSLKDRRSASRFLQLRTRPSKPGVATLWVELAPKSIDLKPDQVKEYLDEIGASETVRSRWAGMPEPRHWRELYTKHAKAFVRIGLPEGDRSWAEPVGMGLEIVPEKDLTALRPGEELPIQILLQGKPLPSFAVGLVREGETHGLLKNTDGQGRVALPIGKSGRWLLRATDLRPSSKPGADWESDFAAMTFEVRSGESSACPQHLRLPSR
jgi:uncharacterized GH25 family protein